MGRVDGKVALVTGAARGQGRSHAVRLAEEGADIVALDICDEGGVDTTTYPLGSQSELDETAALVEQLDRRVVARKADVRDLAAMEAAVAAATAELGPIDIVCANAGIGTYGFTWELSEESWKDMLDVNLTGVWHTCKATIPQMIEAGNGGAIVITSSFGGARAINTAGHYCATKHGVVGLMRVLSQELAEHSIRVNTIHPMAVNTLLATNEATLGLFRPDLEHPTPEDAMAQLHGLHALPVPWIEPVDVSNAILWLTSDEGRYVTGTEVTVDAGSQQKMPHA